MNEIEKLQLEQQMKEDREELEMRIWSTELAIGLLASELLQISPESRRRLDLAIKGAILPRTRGQEALQLARSLLKV